MGMYIILISLAIIDLSLLIYVIYYYFNQYKKGLDKIEDVIDNLPTKNNKVIELKDKIKFKDSFLNLNDEQKSFYEQISEYALSFENTFIYSYDYDQRIRIGQRKTLCIISIKNDNLVIKFKMGNIKLDDNESIELKPIKIIIKNENDVNEVKKQLNIAYKKQTGQININTEGEK